MKCYLSVFVFFIMLDMAMECSGESNNTRGVASCLNANDTLIWKHEGIPSARNGCGFDMNTEKMKLVRNFTRYSATIFDPPTDANGRANISAQCIAHLLRINDGLQNMDVWAFKFLDTMAKIPDSITTGGRLALGDFDGCLAINLAGEFRGKSCTVEILSPTKAGAGCSNKNNERSLYNPNIDPSLRQYSFLGKSVIEEAVCVPDSCTENDVKLLIEIALASIESKLKVVVADCQVANAVKIMQWDEYAAIFAVGFIIILAVSGTVADISMAAITETKEYREKSGILMRLLLCFSVYWNTELLVKPNYSKNTLPLLNGMKVLTILWVVLSHSCYWLFSSALGNNVESVEKHRKSFIAQLVINSRISVETFFFISGFLLMYVWMNVKIKKFNLIQYALLRYWRLIPSVMFTIALQRLIYRMGSGPLWNIFLQPRIETCRENWWLNLLAINNIFGLKSCMPWTWFVAADFQLYMTALVVILFIKKNPRVAIINLCLLVVAGAVIPFAVNRYSNTAPFLTPNFIKSAEEAHRHWTYEHFYPYVHATCYAGGMACGYFLYRKRTTLRIPSTVINLGSVVSVAALMAVVFSGMIWQNTDDFTAVAFAAYMMARRITWALALAWTIVSCTIRTKGIFNSFLSWPGFIIPARLTFMVYLMHPHVIFSYYASSRIPIQFDIRTMILNYMGFITISFVCAYIASMLFEAPFMAMRRLALQQFVRAEDFDNDLSRQNANHHDKNGYLKLSERAKND